MTLSMDEQQEFSLDDRYLKSEGNVFLTGIQALVRVVRDRALEDRRQGLTTSSFISGYEGSPLGGYDMEFGRRMRHFKDLDVVLHPGVNEELAATSVMGTQMAREVGSLRSDGVVGYWYGKAPGLDRASDAIRHANLIGTDPRGGAVAFVGDDPGAKSSSLACASESMLASLLIPTLYPADPQDVLDMGVHAAYMSRVSGLWSALKIVTNVADAAASATVGGGRQQPSFGDMAASTWRPNANLFAPNLIEMERSLYEVRLPRAMEYARVNQLDRTMCRTADDRIGIVASGKTYLDLREALDRLGLDEEALRQRGVRLLKLAMIHPLDPRTIGSFAAGLDEVIIVEEKRPFIEDAIKVILHGTTGAPAVIGKRTPDGRILLPVQGELDPMLIAERLGRHLSTAHNIPVVEMPARRKELSLLPLLPRTPYFCSGCPHNSSTKVPDGALVAGGIGCHSMVMLMDDKQTGDVVGLTQMGGEGAQWIGISPFVEENHLLQNIGDGTFTHSGTLALRAAVASGTNITYKLLYNATVAMTGGQDPVGAMPLDRLVRLLLAEGVKKVVVTTEDLGRVRKLRLPRGVEVRDRDDLVDVQAELTKVAGVTVLVHDQECAAEKRRKRRRKTMETPEIKVVINERICEGCGDCGEKSNCLSVQPVQTAFGRKTQIHQGSCNFDYSCLKGDCPAFVTVHPGGEPATAAIESLDADLPAPELLFSPDDYGMRIMGIGGTGIVTVSQVLSTAAVLDGLFVRSVDQTGLAQKGGAVVSDVKLSRQPLDSGAKIVEGGCDLYLACDSLVGTDPVNLKVTAPQTTVAVVSTAEVPTGSMVADTAVGFPTPATVTARLQDSSARLVLLDPSQISRALFNDEQYANFILVGAAFQVGALPLTAEALERAIELNGVDVDRNVQAFRRGRQAIADPAAFEDVAGRIAEYGEVAPESYEQLVDRLSE